MKNLLLLLAFFFGFTALQAQATLQQDTTSFNSQMSAVFAHPC